MAIIEFLFVAPILVLFSITVSEIGFTLREAQVVSYAAREGARSAANSSLNGFSCADLESAAEEATKQHLLTQNVMVDKWTVKAKLVDPVSNSLVAGTPAPRLVEVVVSQLSPLLMFLPDSSGINESVPIRIEVKETFALYNPCA